MKKIASLLTTMTAFPLALMVVALSGTIALAPTAFAENIDPFATPPKNLKPEDAQQFYTTQSTGAEEGVIPAVPAPPPFSGDDVPKQTVTTGVYTGILMESEIAGEYLLKTADQTITLKTAKDLTQYLGQEIVVETQSSEDGMSIKSISIGAPETPDENLMHAAPTGPSAWVMAIVVLGMILGFVGIGMYRKDKLLNWIGYRKSARKSNDDDSSGRLF